MRCAILPHTRAIEEPAVSLLSRAAKSKAAYAALPGHCTSSAGGSRGGSKKAQCWLPYFFRGVPVSLARLDFACTWRGVAFFFGAAFDSVGDAPVPPVVEGSGGASLALPSLTGGPAAAADA